LQKTTDSQLNGAITEAMDYARERKCNQDININSWLSVYNFK
jgi:hypothetical protein